MRYLNPQMRLDMWEQFEVMAMALFSAIDDLWKYQDKDEKAARVLSEIVEKTVDFIRGHLPELRKDADRYEEYREKHGDLLDKLEGRWWSKKQRKFLTFEEYRKEVMAS